jgi:tetratricopeptide (TPR) repeat protein
MNEVLHFVKGLTKITVAYFLVLTICFNVFAQYRGAPVKKERLLKALRSKQLQTNDIVAVINSNGVDFSLTPETRKALIAAGARPEVIQAVANNQRKALTTDSTIATTIIPQEMPTPDYEELIDKAMFSYKEQNNPTDAVRYLETAVKMNPKDAKAYQMLGFVNLYGLNNLTEAQKYMRESIINGGSAVFRVFHDDNGNFIKRCSGSLYISPEKIRFESDDNTHTFETSTINVEKIKFDRETTQVWKNYPIFKVFLKLGNTEAKFRFAPINGKEAESNMAGQFINESKVNNFTALTIFSSR